MNCENVTSGARSVHAAVFSLRLIKCGCLRWECPLGLTARAYGRLFVYADGGMEYHFSIPEICRDGEWAIEGIECESTHKCHADT